MKDCGSLNRDEWVVKEALYYQVRVSAWFVLQLVILFICRSFSMI
ncbi:hypothetical protein [Thermosporothrix hazakensis]|nr:hypothetical protein [Thermosporothrix hazakensis]